MERANISAETLRKQIFAAEEDLDKLKNQLAELEAQNVEPTALEHESEESVAGSSQEQSERQWPLSPEEYQTYGRQMIVPYIGIQGQLRLKASSVLIIGVGGLGCPAAAYLAGAGVGALGLIDGDTVETSNLHRQILHSTKKTGMLKVDSAIDYLKSLNPNVAYANHSGRLTPANSPEIVASYDLVLDCTDHPTSRYLISDICVLLSKPLVSASALRTDGQLTVLNYPPKAPGDATGGPCYRCIFPKPPPAESVVSCGDGGIIGPVVGVMGVLQALEAIKVIVAGLGEPGVEAKPLPPPNLLLFSTNGPTTFRSVKLRPRRAKCFACSDEATLSLESLTSGSLDYVMFCGVTSTVNLLDPKERIEADIYNEARKAGKRHLLIDVREKVQFDICSLEGSVNVPFSSLPSTLAEKEKPAWIPEDLADDAPIYVVCRLGNDSQVATKKLKEAGLGGTGRYIGDIRGGLEAWKAKVDLRWPDY